MELALEKAGQEKKRCKLLYYSEATFEAIVVCLQNLKIVLNMKSK
jgi:hypothetical protein